MATIMPPDENGNKDHELTGLHNMPIIETPWSWVSDHWWTFQSGKCAQDEYYFLKCVGHVGVARAPTECKQLHDDFVECVFRFKTVCVSTIPDSSDCRCWSCYCATNDCSCQYYCYWSCFKLGLLFVFVI